MELAALQSGCAAADVAVTAAETGAAAADGAAAGAAEIGAAAAGRTRPVRRTTSPAPLISFTTKSEYLQVHPHTLSSSMVFQKFISVAKSKNYYSQETTYEKKHK